MGSRWLCGQPQLLGRWELLQHMPWCIARSQPLAGHDPETSFSPIFAARLCCHGVFIHRLQHFQHLGRHPAYESQDSWLGQVHRICFRWCYAEGKDVPLSNPSFFSTVLRFNIRIRVSIQGLLPVTVRVKLTWPHEMYVILFTFDIIYDHHIAYIYIFNYCAKHWSEKNFTEWACRDHSSTGKMHRGGNLPRNDHNCIKAVAIAAPLLFHQRTLLGGQIWWLDIHLMACERSTDHWAEVSNILGALQLMLAVSIFQSLCVAEFPLEDSDQTFRSKD